MAAISRVQTEVAFVVLSGSQSYMHAYMHVQGRTSPIVCVFIVQPHQVPYWVLLIPILLVLESWSGYIFHPHLCVPEMEQEQPQKQVHPGNTETIQTKKQDAKRGIEHCVVVYQLGKET